MIAQSSKYFTQSVRMALIVSITAGGHAHAIIFRGSAVVHMCIAGEVLSMSQLGWYVPHQRCSQILLPGFLRRTGSRLFCFTGWACEAPVLLSPNYLALYPSSSSCHLWPSSVNQITLSRKLKVPCVLKCELTVRAGWMYTFGSPGTKFIWFLRLTFV